MPSNQAIAVNPSLRVRAREQSGFGVDRVAKLDKGGHFAAWEQPELFTKEIRAAFKSLRNGKQPKGNSKERIYASRR